MTKKVSLQPGMMVSFRVERHGVEDLKVIYGEIAWPIPVDWIEEWVDEDMDRAQVTHTATLMTLELGQTDILRLYELVQIYKG